MANTTAPNVEQRRAFKNAHPDSIHLFRVGDFYEMFADDAVEVARAIGLTITNANGVLLAGLPYHSAETYIKQIVAYGLKVAICEQVTDPYDTHGTVSFHVPTINLKLKCTTCGDKGDCGGTIPKCAGCWEFEHRLEDYLRTNKGKLIVAKALGAAIKLPIVPRGPWDDTKPDGYQASDKEFLETNREAAVWFLDHAQPDPPKGQHEQHAQTNPQP